MFHSKLCVSYFQCMDGELFTMKSVVDFHLHSEASPVFLPEVPARAGSSKGWQVSSYGRCCSSHGIISDGYLHPSGYRQVKICGQNYNVHRVVMLAFKGPPPNEKAWQVHHKDGNRANNRLDNLEYVTPRQNTLHAVPTRRTGGPAIPVMWRRLGTENWTFCPHVGKLHNSSGRCLTWCQRHAEKMY